MTIITRTFAILAAAIALSACSSVPKYEKISAKYMNCEASKLKPAEITNHGWYRSWYVDCNGQEYFCRHSPSNENGWNGCHPTTQSAERD